MVLVPGGEFTMGSNDSDDEKPPHRVHLDGFHIDKYEVANGLFERFTRATAHRTTAERDGWAYAYRDGKWEKVNGAAWRTPSGPGSSAEPSHPVAQVSWEDASAYCKWAGKRLPTEAEWEKAARGTDGRKYPWGDQWDSSKASSENN